MAQSQFMYANGVTRLLSDATISWIDGNVKCALLTGSYTPDQDTDDFFGDIDGNEIGDTGSYVAGGKALSNVSVDDTGYSDPGYMVTISADDIYWTGMTSTFRYAVLYYYTGNVATSPLLACIDIQGSNISPVAQTFGINFNSNGVLQIISSV